MSMNVNQDYSQFYAGTELIKSYGSNPAVKKDTLVKYRFNTTDEHGNKVMDKMSKEETMKAANDTELYEFQTEETLYQTVEEFAYVTYNHVRPHSFNGYRTPYQARIAS